MKVYPVNEDALDALAILNRDATILLTIAGALWGFTLDLAKDLVMASDAAAQKLALMFGINITAGSAAVAITILGVLKWVERGNKLKAIKANADFSDAEG